MPEGQERIDQGQSPFIMIPRHKELHCQEEIVKEIKRIGGEELVDNFEKNL